MWTPAFDLLLWAAIASATFLLLWPAIWERGPIDTLTRMIEFVRFTGAQPDEVGSFFAGQVSGDPGPLYYPVATLYRLSLLVTVGLVALAIVARRLEHSELARVGWLLVYIFGFGLMMTLGAKKFDRYLLPIFPGLVALAAVGIVTACQALARRLDSSESWLAGNRAWGLPLAVCAGVALAAWPLASTYPYPLAYYNPLLGGGGTAQRMVMVGNGEGLDQAAQWLREQPDAASLEIAAHSWDILAGLVPSGGERLTEGVPNSADYIVTYGRRIQMRRWGGALDRYLAANPPVHVVRINGIEYVHIHPGPTRGRRP